MTRHQKRTAEYRISNYESSSGGQVSKGRIAALYLYSIIIGRILYFEPPAAEHSLFIIRYSPYYSFFYDQTGRLLPPAVQI